MENQDQGSLAGVEAVVSESGVVTIADHSAELDVGPSGIHGLRTVMVNVYSVTAPDGSWVLIDAGLPGSTGKIAGWAEHLHGSTRPSALLLTHGHFDHTGAIADLAQRWQVPVYVHEAELPFVTGQRTYPPAEPGVGGGLMSILSPFFPTKPVDISGIVSALPASGEVPGLPGWQWLPTPGHTDGHVSFFEPTHRTLIAGDAITTTKQESFWAILRQKAELHGPPAYFTSDWDAAKRSVQMLAQLRPRYIAAGHGKPVAGDAAAAGLAELAGNFDEVARPR